MSVTLTLGWWLAPLAVTMAVFAFSIIVDRSESRPTSYASIGNAVVGIFMYGAATIISLFAWLIWALLA